MPENPAHHHVLVIGGGNGGVSVAARLRRMGVKDIALIEPREQHLYKPLFSHVAGGTARAGITVRPQRDVMPKGVTWIQDAVASIDPDTSTVALESGATISYGHVIVCPGVQHDWESVPGLAEALETPSAASHYEYALAAKASPLLRDLKSGTVVFTQPPGPGSCDGASQKPMYQACDYWRATGVLDDIRVVMVVPTGTVFGLPAIDRELDRNIAKYGIELRTRASCSKWMPPPERSSSVDPTAPSGFRTTCSMPSLRSPRRTGSSTRPCRPPATRAAMSRSTPRRCVIRGSRTCGRSGTRRARRIRSAAERCASRPSCSRRTWLQSSVATSRRPATTATRCARSPCHARRSCGPSSTTEATLKPTIPFWKHMYSEARAVVDLRPARAALGVLEPDPDRACVA